MSRSPLGEHFFPRKKQIEKIIWFYFQSGKQFSNPLRTVHPKQIFRELLHNLYIEETLLCSDWCSELQMNSLQRSNHPQQHDVGADCQDKEQGSLAVPSLLFPCQQRHSTHSSFQTVFMEASVAVSLIPSVPHLLYHLQSNTKKQ